MPCRQHGIYGLPQELTLGARGAAGGLPTTASMACSRSRASFMMRSAELALLCPIWESHRKLNQPPVDTFSHEHTDIRGHSVLVYDELRNKCEVSHLSNCRLLPVRCPLLPVFA